MDTRLPGFALARSTRIRWAIGAAILLALVLLARPVLHRNIGFVQLLRAASSPVDLARAQGTFQDAISLWNDGRSYLGLGLAHFRSKQMTLAIDDFSRGLDYQPSEPILTGWLGEAYLANGQPERAAIAWAHLSSGAGDRTSLAATRLMEAGYLDDALLLLRQVLRSPDLGDGERLVLLNKLVDANIYRWREPAETLDYARQALVLAPQSGDQHRRLAWAFLQMSNYEGAAAESSQAIRLGDESNEPYEILGRALRALGRTDEAIVALQQSIARANWVLYPHIELGRAYLAKGMRHEALAEFRIAVSIAPGSTEALEGVSRTGGSE